MKKIILLISLVWMIGLVSAIEPGIYTQEQIDSVNATTVSLQCYQEEMFEKTIIFYKYYVVPDFCLDVKDLGDGSYDVFYKSFEVKHAKRDVRKCKREGSTQRECYEEGTDNMRQQHAYQKSIIRNRIRGFQSDSDFDLGGFLWDLFD